MASRRSTLDLHLILPQLCNILRALIMVWGILPEIGSLICLEDIINLFIIAKNAHVRNYLMDPMPHRPFTKNTHCFLISARRSMTLMFPEDDILLFGSKQILA